MSIEGQGHFFTIYFPGFVCFVLYFDKISGERLQDRWSSGYYQCEFMENLASHTFVLVNACFCLRIQKRFFLYDNVQI